MAAPSDREIIARIGPVGKAFFGHFDSLRDVQRRAIPTLASGSDALVLAATASGKTEAVIAPMVSRLLKRDGKGQTIRMLAIAPTRALVNDLYARLEAPLQRLSWRVGRQTSDHSEAASNPDLLITTPESLDSMLVRRSVRKEGNLIGHALASVGAIFIDEAHLYANTARGDQVTWLVARMRRLREIAHKNGWTSSPSLQVCGASATVGSPEALASHLMGGSPAIVRVPGRREIDLLDLRSIQTADDEARWLNLDGDVSVDSIRRAILASPQQPDHQAVAQLVRQALSDPSICRKALIFVGSRTESDGLSATLNRVAKHDRAIEVFGHHGSLSKEVRERAETGFNRSRDAILVATTTLEVGVDIGDVDVVVLAGAPPDVNGLLQRIGRAGRRSGRTRVVAIPYNEVQSLALASMLDAAARGELDAIQANRRWSVLVQQTASLVAQAGDNGRPEADVMALAAAAWPETTGTHVTMDVLDHLVGQKVLIREKERLFLGDDWSDARRESGGRLHHNLDGSPTGTAVINALTNETIAYVDRRTAFGGGDLSIGGRTYKREHVDKEIVVRPNERDGAAPTYKPNAGPSMSLAYASHVRRALGFDDIDAPYLESKNGLIWFHFGGVAYELGLRVMFPHLSGIQGLQGLAVRGLPPDQNPVAGGAADALRDEAKRLARLLAPGPWFGYLPDEMALDNLIALFDVTRFERWLDSRKVFHATGNRRGAATLNQWLA